jgi:hypothetical protein
MASTITSTRAPTPEERELAAKNADLAVLKIQLAQRELDFATLRVELRGFEQRYLRIVGIKFAAIDDLEALIAGFVSTWTPAAVALIRNGICRCEGRRVAAFQDVVQLTCSPAEDRPTGYQSEQG